MVAENKERVIVSITKEQAAAVRTIADAYGITKSTVIQIALTAFLNSKKGDLKKCLA